MALDPWQLRSLAQRPLPSMMIATCAGRTASALSLSCVVAPDMRLASGHQRVIVRNARANGGEAQPGAGELGQGLTVAAGVQRQILPLADFIRGFCQPGKVSYTGLHLARKSKSVG